MSFWSEAAGKPQVETGGDFPSLPDKKWFSSRTTTEEHGGAKPTIKTVPTKDGDVFQFNIGLIADGSEADVDARMKGQFCFFSAWITPNPESSDKDNLISGRLTGFLNSIYATGIALDEKDKKKRAGLRWQATIGELEKIATEEGLTLDQFDGPSNFIAAVAITDLQKNSKRVLFKSRTRTFKKKDGTQGSSVEVGAYEDAVQENLDKRKVSSFEDRGTEGGGTTF